MIVKRQCAHGENCRQRASPPAVDLHSPLAAHIISRSKVNIINVMRSSTTFYSVMIEGTARLQMNSYRIYYTHEIGVPRKENLDDIINARYEVLP